MVHFSEETFPDKMPKYTFLPVLLAYFLFASFLPVLTAQEFVSVNYTTEDGLPSNETYHILEDSKGYIWISTDRGVCRYDGYEFKVFNSANGLLDNTVFETFEDYQGRIWMATLSNQLFYYQNDSIHAYWNNNVIRGLYGKIQTGQQVSIHVDSFDHLYLGFAKSGLIKIFKTGKYELLSDTNYSVLSKHFNDGKYIFGSHTKLESDTLSFNINGIKLQTKIDKLGMANWEITKLNYGSYNYALLNVPGSTLILLNQDGTYKIIQFEKEVTRLIEFGNGDLWIAFQKSGYCIFNSSGEKKEQGFINFPGRSIHHFMKDRQGGIWLATGRKGIYYIRNPSIRVFKKEGGLDDNTIQSIKTLGKDSLILNYWFKPFQIFHLDQGTGFLKQTEWKNSDNILDTYFDIENKSFYFSSLGQIKNLDLKSWKLTNYPSDSFDCFIIKKSGETIYCGANSLLHKFNLPNRKIEKSVKTDTKIHCLYMDTKNRLWIGCTDGLYQYENDSIKKVKEIHPSLNSRISKIGQINENIYVFSTIGNGLFLFNEGDSNLVKLNKSNVLKSNFINDFVIDNERTIYAATNRGLEIIDNLTNPIVQYFGTNQGFPTSDIRGIGITSGYIWLTTLENGLIRMDKNIGKATYAKPLIHLNKTFVNNEITELNGVHLSYNQNNIDIYYTGIEYNNSKKPSLKYKYRLDPVHKGWRYTNELHIDFLSLRPGKYTLTIKAENDNGMESARPNSLNFNIARPLWQEEWFLVSALLLIMGLTYGLLKIWMGKRQAKALKNSIIQNKITDTQMNALRNQINSHFIFNSLTSIQAMILKGKNEEADSYLTRFSKLVRLIVENGSEELVPLSDEINLMELYLNLEKMRYGSRLDYRINIAITNYDEMYIPPMILQPYVENAMEHSITSGQESGWVEIKINQTGKYLQIIISDNGAGINKSLIKTKKYSGVKRKSIGLLNTSDRIELMNLRHHTDSKVTLTDRSIENPETTGTRVELKLKFQNRPKYV